MYIIGRPPHKKTRESHRPPGLSPYLCLFMDGGRDAHPTRGDARPTGSVLAALWHLKPETWHLTPAATSSLPPACP
jgi:hypothetical protein